MPGLELISMEFLIPFFFALAIVYGALGVSGVFKNKAVNAIIAVVFAFVAATSPDVSSFMYNIMPYAAIFFVGMFLLAIILKPFKGIAGEGKGELLIIILVLLLVLFARMQVTGIVSDFGFLSSTNLVWAIGIIIVAFVLYKAYKIGEK